MGYLQTHIDTPARGSSTYEWMLRHVVELDKPGSRDWVDQQPTWDVTSCALPGVTGADFRFGSGDVRPVDAKMQNAAARQNIWIVGGSDLSLSSTTTAPLEEIIVQVGSVCLAACNLIRRPR